MKTPIPKIIHQIWSGVDEPLPEYFSALGETWKKYHPEWRYEFWNNDRMNSFVQRNYPDYWEVYSDFQYNVQRWDAIRYLILDKIGGMYVDFDTECLSSHNTLLANKTCCFSMEPEAHGKVFNKELYFNNALMASIPNHPFIKTIIENVFQYKRPLRELSWGEKILEILNTTGPLLLLKLYEEYPDKESIYLIPAKYVSPFTDKEIKLLRQGYESDELENKLEEAYSIHYFFNGWV